MTIPRPSARPLRPLALAGLLLAALPVAAFAWAGAPQVQKISPLLKKGIMGKKLVLGSAEEVELASTSA